MDGERRAEPISSSNGEDWIRPKIGIVVGPDWEGKITLNRAYVEAVANAGALPVLLPVDDDGQVSTSYLEYIDGLLLPGGGDVDPLWFGQEPKPGTGAIFPERDQGEIRLVQEAEKRDLPVLGICRGVQIINIALGGDIYQDLKELPSALKHMQEAPRWYPTHSVRIEGGTLLAQAYPAAERRVNSFHHQAVKNLAPGFKACAWAADGVIEAIESPGHRFLLGVQWHPECMWDRDPFAQDLFLRLTRACLAQGAG